MNENICEATTSTAATGEERCSSLAAVRRGDLGAWESLLREWRPLVAATVRRQGLRDGECEDVVQTVWLRLLGGIDGIRDEAALPGWLVTTSRREAWAARHRARREEPCADLPADEPSSGCDDVFDEVDRNLAAARLRPCVALLPPRERRLVEALLDPREFSYREISRRLDMPVGAIGPVRCRAVARLRRLLGARDDSLPAAG
ncbi:RNA polymerase sigma factor [Kineococcus sp. NUM-3379]